MPVRVTQVPPSVFSRVSVRRDCNIEAQTHSYTFSPAAANAHQSTKGVSVHCWRWVSLTLTKIFSLLCDIYWNYRVQLFWNKNVKTYVFSRKQQRSSGWKLIFGFAGLLLKNPQNNNSYSLLLKGWFTQITTCRSAKLLVWNRNIIGEKERGST